MRRRRSFVCLVALAVVGLVASACSASSGGSGGAARQVKGDALTVNTGTAKPGGSITYVIERNIVDWNPLAADIGVATQLVADAYDPQTFTTAPDLKTVQLNKDLLVSAEQVSTSPQTLVYKISPKAVWSDGTPITVDDFKYTWAVSDPKQCPKCEVASTIGYDHFTSVVGSDGGRTVTVTLDRPYSDWKSLFSPLLPAHIAKQVGDDGTPAGLAKSFNTGFRYQGSFPKWSGGPYMIQSWQDNRAATLVPNPRWYGKPATLKTVIFRVITDTTQEVPALANDEVQVINPQPQVDLLRNVRNTPGVSYQLVHGLRKQMISPNLNHPVMRSVALRKALFTATNVKEIITKTVGQFDQSVVPLRNRFYVPEQKPGYEDTLGELGTGNVAKAKQILQAAGYKITSGRLIDPQGKPVPTLLMRYFQNDQIQQTECELFAATAKQLGVSIKIQSTDSIGETVTHQPGKDYDLFTLAFVGQTFIPTQYSQFFVTKQGLNFDGYSNPTVDKLMGQALEATDPAQVASILDRADRVMTDNAFVLPLYQMPDLLAYRSNIVNLRSNGTYFGPPYNVGEWGVK